MKEEFIQAIKNKQKVEIEFYSKDDQGYITRVCAPMDYGPSRRSPNGGNRYHVWDYYSDSIKGAHQIPLAQEQIKSFKVLDETFNPEEFVSWDPDWFIQRDWGDLS